MLGNQIFRSFVYLSLFALFLLVACTPPGRNAITGKAHDSTLMAHR